MKHTRHTVVVLLKLWIGGLSVYRHRQLLFLPYTYRYILPSPLLFA